MALDYTEIYTQTGRAVYWANAWVAYQNSLCLTPTTGEADNVQAQFTGGDLLLIPNFQNQVVSQANTMQSWVSAAVSVADAVLQNLQSALNAPSNATSVIIPLLAAQMVVDSQTVQSTIISTPSVTPAGTNNGNGLLKLSTMNSAGITDERGITEVVTLRCFSSQWNGGTAGAEQFSVVGYPVISPTVYGPQGSGTSTLPVADSVNILLNGDFESWSNTNTPVSWTIVSGVAGVNIFQENALVHSGTAALKLAGDGATATIELAQTFTTNAIQSTTVYAAGIWLRKNGTVTAGSTLTIALKGTGASTQTVLALDPSTLTTSYVLHWIFFATSNNVPPSDYRFDIKWTAANTAGALAVILIDNAVTVTPVAFGHVQYAIFRGSSDFAVADQISVSTSVYSSGVFQTFFAQFYNQSLPSSVTPSLSDALAE